MLATEITSEVQTLERCGDKLGKHFVNLAQAHGALLEDEIKGGAKTLRLNVLLCSLTVALSVTSLVIFAITLAELLVEQQPTFFSRAGSFALVGGGVLLATIVCGIVARRKMGAFSLYPEKSLASIRETAECLMNRT